MPRQPKPNPNDTTFTVRLSKQDLKALKAIKKDTGKCVSVLLRQTLQYLIFEHQTNPEYGGNVPGKKPQS